MRSTEKIELGNRSSEQGSALVIALFVLVLISGFVVLATTRTATEAAAVGNEVAEGRALYAAQGALEVMTRNFNKVYEVKLNPTAADRATVVDEARIRAIPGFDNFTFQPELDPTDTGLTNEERTVVLPGGPFAGLYAIRSNWRLRTTVTDPQGIQVQLTRNILNNQIPIFQFGIFYDDDLELYRPPLFSFGGRVHSNRHFFMSPGPDGVYFDSRVTAAGHIVTQTWRNGHTGDNYNGTWIKDASGVFRQLHRDNGSVLNGTPNVFASDPDLPPSRLNANWRTSSTVFDGNLQAETKQLRLPLKVGADADQNSLIEMIKRPKEQATAAGGDLASNGNSAVPVTAATADNDILRAERFANKPGIRVSLSDSKAKLPGCATSLGSAVATSCGARLDGHISGQILATDPTAPLTVAAATSAGNLGLASRGYNPMLHPMTDGYQATRVNGERLNAGSGNAREVWIKIETVAINEATGAVITQDITADILSLGVTEQAPTFGGNLSISGYNHTVPGSSLIATTPQTPSTGTDSRSIIKLQRFAIPGPAITGGSSVLNNYTASGGYNAVVRYSNANATRIAQGCVGATPCTLVNVDPNSSTENYGHLKLATVNSASGLAIVPFPIKMFDMREGLYYDERSTTYYPSGSFGTMGGTNQRLPVNGIMSVVDIDVANLRRFLRGDFDGRLPVTTPYALANSGSLRSTDIPENGGWVFYVSDRRGDFDFDGEFDMEDVYVNGDQTTTLLQLGEDVNFNNQLDTRFCVSLADHNCEAERYRIRTIATDTAAVNDHKYYRRGVRLINGTTIPGIYDSANSSNTKGFTVASENGIYVQGNYNATHVVSVPSTGNTPYNDYRPLNTATHIPASVVADGVTILSNNWNDARSFVFPFDRPQRPATETTIRFAMISGDTLSTREATPHQGGIGPRMNGGVHNFKRFLEMWTNPANASFRINLNYSGSLINLYNSRNANGSFKCCNLVYNPPVRNWVFDSTFLDPGRLPPGTPFFQYVQTTGFMRTND